MLQGGGVVLLSKILLGYATCHFTIGIRMEKVKKNYSYGQIKLKLCVWVRPIEAIFGFHSLFIFNSFMYCVDPIDALMCTYLSLLLLLRYVVAL